MANFETALAGMRKGERWRRKGWKPDSFFISSRLLAEDGCDYYTLGGAAILADDWERYEEPAIILTAIGERRGWKMEEAE